MYYTLQKLSVQKKSVQRVCKQLTNNEQNKFKKKSKEVYPYITTNLKKELRQCNKRSQNVNKK